MVETFCAVEMYLPDYLSKLIPQVRANRGRAWMLANWGYEESKHSMAFGDWLLRSRSRSDEQMADLEATVFCHEWQLPWDNGRAMVCYTMVQEVSHLAALPEPPRTAGRGGRRRGAGPRSQAGRHRRARHYDFFRRLVALYLEDDREGTLEQLRRIVNTFAMPAVHLLADSRKRTEDVKKLRIFDEDIYYYQVFEPVVQALGLTKADLRRHTRREVMPPSPPGAPEGEIGRKDEQSEARFILPLYIPHPLRRAP